MLLERGQETGEGDAHGIKSRRKFCAVENSLRISEEIESGHRACGLGNDLHGGAHLWDSGSVAHDTGKLARSGLGLSSSWLSRQGRKSSGQNQGPQNSEPSVSHVWLPPRYSVGRRFGFRRRLDGKFRRARNALIRKRVRGDHFDDVFARGQGSKGEQALDGDLIARLFHVPRSFLELHNLLGAALDGKLELGVGLVSFVVGLEIVYLHVNAELIGGGEIAIEARAHFGRAEDKLSRADLFGRHMLELVGED